MPSITLPQSALLSQDMLVQGVIESIITVDRLFEMLPFAGIVGNSLAYNRELALGDVQFATVGDVITAKNPATFVQVQSSLTKIIGDAEVDGLIKATRSNINDQEGAQIISKAKSVGRTYADTLINGTGVGNSFNGLLNLVSAAQTITPGAAGPLAFLMLDELLDQVKDKDGVVDFLVMHSRTQRSYFDLLRNQGGVGIGETVTLPSGAVVPGYRGTPIFRNDYVPVNLGGGTETSVIAGNFDDGSMSIGIAGLTAETEAGIQVNSIGEHQDRDETITRVKWYCGLANFSELGLAVHTGITN